MPRLNKIWNRPILRLSLKTVTQLFTSGIHFYEMFMDLCSLPRYLVEDFVLIWLLISLTQMGFKGAFPDRAWVD